MFTGTVFKNGNISITVNGKTFHYKDRVETPTQFKFKTDNTGILTALQSPSRNRLSLYRYNPRNREVTFYYSDNYVIRTATVTALTSNQRLTDYQAKRAMSKLVRDGNVYDVGVAPLRLVGYCIVKESLMVGRSQAPIGVLFAVQSKTQNLSAPAWLLNISIDGNVTGTYSVKNSDWVELSERENHPFWHEIVSVADGFNFRV